MLSRLPISLVQLQAENNSEKIILCIVQKKLSQTIYNWKCYLKMETVFMSIRNSKTGESNRFLYQFTDKLNLKNPNKNMELANLSIYYTWKNIKSIYSNNKSKTSAPTWNDVFDLSECNWTRTHNHLVHKRTLNQANIQCGFTTKRVGDMTRTYSHVFDLPDASYCVSDIQDYFDFIIKKYETIADNPHVQIYVNKMKSRIVFKIKTGYKLELLSGETMQLLENSEKDVDQNKDGEIVPKLESVEVVLVHCNLVNSDY